MGANVNSQHLQKHPQLKGTFRIDFYVRQRYQFQIDFYLRQRVAGARAYSHA